MFDLHLRAIQEFLHVYEEVRHFVESGESFFCLSPKICHSHVRPWRYASNSLKALRQLLQFEVFAVATLKIMLLVFLLLRVSVV